MQKTDDSILEVCFVIRSYGKGELAMCYIRGVAQQTAVNRFNTWIRKAPGLEQRLQETGLSRLPFPFSHCFAPSARISQRLSSKKLFFPPQTSTKLSEPPYTLMACSIFVEPNRKKGVFLTIGKVMK